MERFFWQMTELGVSGSIAILGVLLFRWGLRNQEKVFSYILWVIAGIRLLVPISYGGVWSFLFSFPEEQGAIGSVFLSSSRTPAEVHGNTPGITEEFSGSEMAAFFAERGWMKLLLFIWLSGVIVLLAKNVVAYIRLRRQVQASIKEGECYLSDNISGAFVLGVIGSKIYLSSHLTGEERKYVLAHEKVHMRRKDYIWKGLAQCILCIHWYNPLVWLAFRAFTVDMEMSCDEAVLRRENRDVRAGYAKALLAETVGSRDYDLIPFFKGNKTERRIHNLMRERKFSRKRLGICAGTVLVAAVLLIPGFWQKNTYGKDKENTAQQKEETAAGEDTVRDGANTKAESGAVERLETEYVIDTEKPGKDGPDSKVESAAGGQEAEPEHAIDTEKPDKDSAGSMAENTAEEKEIECVIIDRGDLDAVKKMQDAVELPRREYGYPKDFIIYKVEVPQE